MFLFTLLKQTVVRFLDDECPRMAAALSYYTVFSLPPLLVLLISLASFMFEPADVNDEVAKHISSVIGSRGSAQIQDLLQRADERGIGLTSGLVGACLLLLGATGIVNELQGALNRVWDVEPDPTQSGIRSFVFKRLTSFAMVLSVAFLLMVSLVLNTFLAAFGSRLETFLPTGMSQTWLVWSHAFASLAIITALFALMYKFLPDANIRWRDVWQGAMVTTLLFVAGKIVLSWYLGSRDLASAYGAASSLVVLLLWIYYATMIFYLGAEFTYVWMEHRGEQAAPERGAMRVERKAQRLNAGKDMP